MLSSRENFLETLKRDGKPDRLVNQYEPETLVLDPVSAFIRKGISMGKTIKDAWGVTVTWPENQPAAVPHHTPENRVIKDITRWREELVIPNIEKDCADWTKTQESAAKVDRSERLLMGIMATGLFEQLHFLMGFEDTLTNMLLEPEAFAELCGAVGEYRMRLARMMVENMRPDIILSHDDWGAKRTLFMSPEVWREFFKPRYAELYSYLHSEGVLVMHHADSFLEPIAGDMAEIGIDVWQGVLPQNDIPRLQKELKGKMALMGGIDAAVIDTEHSTEAEIREETRRACAEYGPGGHFIPSFTYGGPGDLIQPHVLPILKDEIARYNQEVYGIFA
ncbi:MAG: uroporphyrinogen decarboxylase (URO-D) [Peptococcaceae bacterium]|jgi:uroporphyrinogen-III decarboxylase|nr:uroporphyrinogen decarboxylase (URO-D) [Peptococcaceae bacterium]